MLTVAVSKRFIVNTVSKPRSSANRAQAKRGGKGEGGRRGGIEPPTPTPTRPPQGNIPLDYAHVKD